MIIPHTNRVSHHQNLSLFIHSILSTIHYDMTVEVFRIPRAET